MRSATKPKFPAVRDPETTATRPVTKPKLKAVGNLEAAATRSATKPKLKVFHASVQVTRIEEWFVEAKTAEEARALFESGNGQRAQIGECTHFEISKLID